MSGRRAMAGFTLVETMVALALGLMVVGALVEAGLVSLANGRRIDAMTQLTEDATLALALMRQQVVLAGYGVPRGVDAAGGLVLHGFPAVAGCGAAGFADLQASILASPACVADASGSDALEVAHEGSVLSAASSNGVLSGAQPLDCLGNSYAKTHDAATGDDYWLDDSKFYVADGSLYCHGPGNKAGAALVQNVEALQVRYGMAVGRDAYEAAAPPAGSPLWADVVSVTLCVQVRSVVKVLDPASAATLGAWIACDGTARTSTDGYLRRTFTTTVALRNRLP